MTYATTDRSDAAAKPEAPAAVAPADAKTGEPEASAAPSADVTAAPETASAATPEAVPTPKRRSFTPRLPWGVVVEKATRAAAASGWRKPALAAGAVALALAAGIGADRLALRSSAGAEAETLAGLRQSAEEVGRLRTEVHALKTALDGFKAARTDLAARQAQLSDRVEKGTQDTGARLARLGDQLDRIERTQRDPARTAAATDKAAAPATVAANAAQPAPAHPAPPSRQAALDPATTGSLPDARAQDSKAQDARAPVDPRKTPLEGFVLRDVDDGMALVEGRNGRLFEVAPGMTLPGVGRVTALERRGRQWVVVTQKGFIGEHHPVRSY